MRAEGLAPMIAAAARQLVEKHRAAGDLAMRDHRGFMRLRVRAQPDPGAFEQAGHGVEVVFEGVEIDDVEGVEGPAFIGNYCTISPESSIDSTLVLSMTFTPSFL